MSLTLGSHRSKHPVPSNTISFKYAFSFPLSHTPILVVYCNGNSARELLSRPHEHSSSRPRNLGLRKRYLQSIRSVPGYLSTFDSHCWTFKSSAAFSFPDLNFTALTHPIEQTMGNSPFVRRHPHFWRSQKISIASPRIHKMATQHSGAWPSSDSPKRRQHRIAFYAQCDIPLDPSSPLSFSEQVRKVEDRIISKNGAIKPCKCSVQQTLALGRHVPTPGCCFVRVMDSCNVFDVVAEAHDKAHFRQAVMRVAQTRQVLERHVNDLVLKFHLSYDTALNFVTTCPSCQPVTDVPVAPSILSPVVPSPRPVFPTLATYGKARFTAAAPSHAIKLPLIGCLSHNDAIARPYIGCLAYNPTNRKRSVDEMESNQNCSTAIARTFAQQVQALSVRLLQTHASTSAINTIRMLHEVDFAVLHQWVDRLLLAQEEFRRAGKPAKVDLGYHYTSKQNLSSIQKHGLLTLAERRTQNIKACIDHGSQYGDGIYTSSNPYGHHGRYGDVGLLVARLLGSTGEGNVSGCRGARADGLPTVDSTIASRSTNQEIVVMFTSKQCIPIFQFDASQLAPNLFVHPGNKILYDYHAELQTLVDRVINTPRKDLPLPVSVPLVGSGTIANLNGGFVQKCIPSVLANLNGGLVQKCMPSVLTYVAPYRLSAGAASAAGLKLQGDMPNGSMFVMRSDNKCAGYGHAASITIDYVIPCGVQQSYHPNPGKVFAEARHRAYLPETVDGCNLVKRLKAAFMRGQTFNVGFSLTTMRDNSVVWSSIPHKTSLHGGRFGYPDLNYFIVCNAELDKLGIAAATDLRS